ncbi:putative L-lysine 2,3-aminomutase [Lachnellula arida]|uniref:Putative L-lysine 2,3-aminomutase n=1 Tax=Lachnellula arida TaxID=1316785 RepID=A0A8T9BF45_9HELO|nr:putative L-lysine 2,3-aminomutase [Lachnellula arida]
MKWELYSKNIIKPLLAARAPHLNARHYDAAASVFPFRNNPYVVNKLINWSDVPNDPIFRLTFPNPNMLKPEQLASMMSAIDTTEMATEDISERMKRNYIVESGKLIREGLNPHPAGQKEENVPKPEGRDVLGCQHKYSQTVLFFPAEGQFCHAYCTYCFRWAQFTDVGSKQQFKGKVPQLLMEYVAQHPQVRDVLFTGGDPMVMKTEMIRAYVNPLLNNPATSHLDTIRIGTKSLAYWPYRFTTDKDATATLNYFEEIVKSGKQVAIQAHFTHPRELGTLEVQEAMRLIRMTGANIRTQSPLIRGINDSAEVWTEMWNKQTKLGAFPYYMFIERDTGAHDYFSVPLPRAYDIFTDAQAAASGLARTARGPSMSAGPGKIAIEGISEIPAEDGKGMQKVFNLKFLQARNPAWTKVPFYAKFDPEATWLSDLKPAFGGDKFFFEKEYEEHIKSDSSGSSGQMDFSKPPSCG